MTTLLYQVLKGLYWSSPHGMAVLSYFFCPQDRTVYIASNYSNIPHPALIVLSSHDCYTWTSSSLNFITDVYLFIVCFTILKILGRTILLMTSLGLLSSTSQLVVLFYIFFFCLHPFISDALHQISCVVFICIHLL